MTAAKLSAPSTSQIVVSMPDMPPRENSASICALPVFETKPLAIARVERLDVRHERALVGLVDERGDRLAAA